MSTGVSHRLDIDLMCLFRRGEQKSGNRVKMEEIRAAGEEEEEVWEKSRTGDGQECLVC